MTIKLFISYRSTDSSKVDAIVSRLTNIQNEEGLLKYAPWQDKFGIPVGKDWWEAIVDAIIDSQVFVFSISRSALASDVCRAELAYAYKRNRPILPVVLEGEYRYNTITGKYDIDYWNEIPAELNDLRSQFLFYEGISFFPKFETAIAEFQRRNQRDTPAPRPLSPDAKGDSKSSHDLYIEACEYAGHLAFAEAEKYFHRLAQLNDPDYGPVAYDWIGLLREYAELIEVDQPSTQFVFKRRWNAYKSQFPKEFLDGVFDPKGFADRISDKPSQNSSASLQINSSQSDSSISVAATTSLAHLLPAPFTWVEIPGKGYSLSKYPITNAQFEKFIDANGYQEKRWWTEVGWERVEKDRWTRPKFWNKVEWNGLEQPVVGVSWYEAVAFCLWLSDITNEKIMLPTKDQWQYAAQGAEGRLYPWGNEWDATRCNNGVEKEGKGQTTRVRDYEGKGDSPFGLVDMAGNIWEWCLTDYESGKNYVETNASGRILKGSSWAEANVDAFRGDYRQKGYHLTRDNDYGFRIARTLA